MRRNLRIERYRIGRVAREVISIQIFAIHSSRIENY